MAALSLVNINCTGNGILLCSDWLRGKVCCNLEDFVCLLLGLARVPFPVWLEAIPIAAAAVVLAGKLYIQL